MAAVGSLGSTNSESAARSAAGSVSGGAMNGDTASPTTGTWSASSTSRMARKSAAIRMISARESPGIAANVTVSASSTASAQVLFFCRFELAGFEYGAWFGRLLDLRQQRCLLGGFCIDGGGRGESCSGVVVVRVVLKVPENHPCQSE
jgi:hypothetical protein